MAPSIVQRLDQSQTRECLDLLEVLLSNLVLDLDKVIILIIFLLVFIIGLDSLALALTLGLGRLGLLGRGEDFLVVRAVVTRRQDNWRRALLARLGGRGLGSRALGGGSILSEDLLLEGGPGVASGADGEARELGEL